MPRASRECIYNIAGVRAKAPLRCRVANRGTKALAARVDSLVQTLNLQQVIG